MMNNSNNIDWAAKLIEDTFGKFLPGTEEVVATIALKLKEATFNGGTAELSKVGQGFGLEIEKDFITSEDLVDLLKQHIKDREAEAYAKGKKALPDVDLNDPKNMLQFVDDPIDKFNLFIYKWCPHYSHLIDSDDNDVEEIRQMIRALKVSKADGEQK